MGRYDEVSRNGDETVENPSTFNRTELLAQSKVSSTESETQQYVDNKVLPKVSLYSSESTTESPDNKADKKDDKSDNTAPKVEQWGGTPNAPKVRHRPMEVTINDDGTGTVEVKSGDTAWDVARRVLEEEGKRANPPHNPSNKEIYEKLKELEKLNGRNLGILHPGDKLKISADDVKATRDSKESESNTKDNGDGTTTTTSKAGDKTYAVTRNAEGDPVKVEITDGQGKTRVYQPSKNGAWTVDGQPTKDGTVWTGFNHNGQVRIVESEGNETTIYKNGTVSEMTNGKEKVTTKDGTVYQQNDDGSYTKTTPDGKQSRIEGINFRNKNGEISENAKAEIEAEQKETEKKSEPTSKEYRTNNGTYKLTDNDGDSVPDEIMVDNNGTVTKYKRNGDKWQTEDGQTAEMSVDVDPAKKVITVHRTYNQGKASAFKVDVVLNENGTGEEKNAA
jgi:hypothetical protein